MSMTGGCHCVEAQGTPREVMRPTTTNMRPVGQLPSRGVPCANASMVIPWRFLTTLSLILASTAFGEDRLITLNVDATDTTRQILHATLTFPVRPGAFTLLYPKWIPGEHGPTGPI